MRFDELDDLARRVPSHPVVSAADLTALGADPDAVQAALGRWQVPARGIYVTTEAPVVGHLLARVAHKRGGPSSVVSGLVAARHLGLRWVPDLPGAVVLVEPERRRRSVPDAVLVWRTREHARLETTDWDGVPVAPVARVVVDAARQVVRHHRRRLGASASPEVRRRVADLCLREVRGLVLGAVADGRCSADDVRLALGAGSVRDAATIRRACLDADRGAASPPEAELVDGLLDRGVPFWCNVELWRGGRLLAVVDVWLVGTGVGAEVDSEEAHGSPGDLDATLQRHRVLTSVGAELLHVTPTRYRGAPERFHDELLAAAAARVRKGLGDPPGVELRPRGPLLGVPSRAA